MTAKPSSGGKTPVRKSGSQDRKGDIISVTSSGDHNAIAAGRSSKASVVHQEAGKAGPVFESWRQDMEKKIDSAPDLQPADKADLKESVAKITEEASKGAKADPGRLERLINTLSAMGPDIFDVAVATLTNPLAGIGLVLKKIGERAKLEAKSGA